MFLNDPTSKQFDDYEWIRSLTEAQEITADVPEDSVLHDQQAVDPKKIGPFKWENSCGSMSRGGSSRSAKEKSQLSRQRCGGSELVPKAALRLSRHLSSALSGRVGRRIIDGTACQNQSRKKNCFGMIEWKAVREAASRFRPKYTAAHCGGGVDTSKLVSR